MANVIWSLDAAWATWFQVWAGVDVYNDETDQLTRLHVICKKKPLSHVRECNKKQGSGPSCRLYDGCWRSACGASNLGCAWSCGSQQVQRHLHGCNTLCQVLQTFLGRADLLALYCWLRPHIQRRSASVLVLYSRPSVGCQLLRWSALTGVQRRQQLGCLKRPALDRNQDSSSFLWY